MTTANRNLYLELTQPGTTQADDLRRAKACAELEAVNPLLGLSPQAFLELLKQIVSCQELVAPRARTKTQIQLRKGLQALEGLLPPSAASFEETNVWDWESLAQLSVDPFIAFVYRRMVKDVRAMQAAEGA